MDPPPTVLFVHSEEEKEVPVYRSALTHASPVFRNILDPDAALAATPRIPMDDFSMEQIRAFVLLVELSAPDRHDKEFSYASLLSEKGARVIAAALPLVHKYEADSLRELCLSMIRERPNLDCVVAYDTCFDQPRWPDAMVKWLVSATLTKDVSYGGYGQPCGTVARTSVEHLEKLRPAVLAQMLKYINETHWKYINETHDHNGRSQKTTIYKYFHAREPE